MRRDCEPHRGRLLQALGVASLAFGTLGIAGGLGALFGLPLGAAAWALARRDLARMDAGLMDPGGRERTEHGRKCARAATLLSAAYLALWGACFLLLIP